MASINFLLETLYKRRLSSDERDQAYVTHWHACLGLNACSVFGLCPEGRRLDQICRADEIQEIRSQFEDVSEIEPSDEHIWMVFTHEKVLFVCTESGSPEIYHSLPLKVWNR